LVVDLSTSLAPPVAPVASLALDDAAADFPGFFLPVFFDFGGITTRDARA
jgi:hypothetical protein